MLFATVNNQVSAQIEATQEQIKRLQDELKALQEHQQAIGTVEQAAQSAVAQTKNTIAMLKSVAPDELETFKNALLGLFDEDAIASLPDAPIDPQPDEPQDDGDAAIEVEVAEQPSENELEQPDEPQDDQSPSEDNGRVKEPKYSTVGAAQKSFRDMTIRELKREASLAGITGYSNMRKDELIAALEDGQALS